MFHKFKENTSKFLLPLKLNNPFESKEPHELALLACKQLKEHVYTQKAWHEELDKGKMFGVLVVENSDNEIGFITAFSATLNSKNFHPYFVPPIYDMLQKDSYFISRSEEISKINAQISNIELDNNFLAINSEFNSFLISSNEIINSAKEKLKIKKIERNRLRQLGDLSIDFNKESQFQKAEFKRLKKEIEEKFNELINSLNIYTQTIDELKNKRKEESNKLQIWLFEQYKIKNAKGETKNLNEIFSLTPQLVPPAGAGECAAPKLLQYAYDNNLKPLIIAEFWWGASPKGEIRHDGQFYGACKGKCLPILNFMLEGLNVEKETVLDNTSTPEVIFDDEYIMAINKPHNMLSVPGKKDQFSIYHFIKQKFNFEPFIVNRLDQATSGIILISKTMEIYKTLQQQFIKRKVTKIYEALLESNIKEKCGIIKIPLSTDYNNRPCQIVDYKNGKDAVTYFEIISDNRIKFQPITGRTHQLRIHAAHNDGLSTPIIGDNLYGKPNNRLYLHSKEIIFSHPITNKKVHLKTKVPF